MISAAERDHAAAASFVGFCRSSSSFHFQAEHTPAVNWLADPTTGFLFSLLRLCSSPSERLEHRTPFSLYFSGRTAKSQSKLNMFL